MSHAERVKEIIAEHMDVSVDSLDLDAEFVRDLGVDSLDLSELVIAFEQTFKVNIPPERARQLRSGRSAIEFIEANAPATSKQSA